MISYTSELTNGLFKTICADAYESVAKEINCYEMIPDDTPVKLYFDIGYKKPIENGDEEEYYPEIADHLIERATSLITDILLNMNDGEKNLQPHSPKFKKYGNKTPTDY